MAFLSGWYSSYYNNNNRADLSSSSSGDDDDERAPALDGRQRTQRNGGVEMMEDDSTNQNSNRTPTERSALTAVLEGDLDSEADRDTRPAIENPNTDASTSTESQQQQQQDHVEDLDAKAQQLSSVGMCSECGDQPASLSCSQCEDHFCALCFSALHRTGNRAKHTTTKYVPPSPPNSSSTAAASSSSSSSSLPVTGSSSTSSDSSSKKILDTDEKNNNSMEEDQEEEEQHQDTNGEGEDTATNTNTNSDDQNATTENPELAELAERCRYIPLRLTLDERKKLRLLEATLNVSEYTDKIDVYSYKSKTARIHAQIHDICAILSGLIVASDYRKGQRLIQDHEFKDNELVFQSIFEIGRRYKIMNPERMRDSYGKLMYMLMDSVSTDVQQLLQFSCATKVSMVYDTLESAGCLALLRDEELLVATTEIVADRYPNRNAVERAIKIKERAIERIVRRYAREYSNFSNPFTRRQQQQQQQQQNGISEEQLRRCLYSMSDSNAYLRANRDPCLKMIQYLQTYFRPTSYESNFSLAIVGGHDGARLTHSHSTQYAYVLQSLTLWSIIADEMFKLWSFSEEDLLDEANMYRLCDTGQGLNRVQRAPRVGRAMQKILFKAQQQLGSWVGSSVVHLGDQAVPNAFTFIDKYTQICRILNPILIAISQLDEIAKDRAILAYINGRFGGVEKAKKLILSDFFRHGFDGSGADNFFDAGSCIDGRLTSAWNWCAQIEKKSFFPLFLLTGFTGFDGAF